MIAKIKQENVPEWHEPFLQMLPQIERRASLAFRGLPEEIRQEKIQDVVCHAMEAFKRLHDQGKPHVATAGTLATNGIKRTRCGRKLGMKMNVRDVSSRYCQQQKDLWLQRLDHQDHEDDAWHQILIEDRRAGPAEIAATRIDFRAWLRVLSKMQKEAATRLAVGETTGAVAKMLGVSSGRISQLRRELAQSWCDFQNGPAGQSLETAAA